jgi:cytosine/adenosine deaminase-related metal-dependent hydrolase
MTHDLLLRDVRPMGGKATDVLVRDGRIAAIGEGLSAEEGAAEGAAVEAGEGALLLPGLVEAHTHLDKTLWGMPWTPNSAGPRLIDKIENERRLKGVLGIDPARQSARQLVQSLSRGTTHIRTHVDIDLVVKLDGLDGVLKTRDAYRDVMDIEIVAFPQSGVMAQPGTLAMLDEAMVRGADVIGGLDPSAIDRDPKGQLDGLFALAGKHGKQLDIHLHEPGSLGAFTMDMIIERTRALSMQGKVTISHAFCLGDPDRDLVQPLVEALAELDIAIMTTGSPSRPVPSLKQLKQAGVRTCSGSDGIRDTWGPYGDGDMLERAMFLGLRNNFRRDEEVEIAFDVCTRGGASVMGLEGYGVAVGDVADLILVDGATITHAVVAHPPRRLVVKRGRVVARDGRALVEAP